MYYFDPKHYSRKEWKGLYGKVLACGREDVFDDSSYKGVGLASAYISGKFACLKQALPHASVDELVTIMGRKAFLPTIELGY